MDLSLLYWEFSGFLFICTAGFLSHFIYDWSGKNKIIGVLGAVNESVWEHQKLVFWPSLIFALVESFFHAGSEYSFWFAKAASIVFMPLFIITVHYTYKRLLGKRLIFVDISLFFVAAALGQFLSFRLMTAVKVSELINNISILTVTLLALLFIFFTFNPIRIHLFRDGTNGKYGIDI